MIAASMFSRLTSCLASFGSYHTVITGDAGDFHLFLELGADGLARSIAVYDASCRRHATILGEPRRRQRQCEKRERLPYSRQPPPSLEIECSAYRTKYEITLAALLAFRRRRGRGRAPSRSAQRRRRHRPR